MGAPPPIGGRDGDDGRDRSDDRERDHGDDDDGA